jgi:hypothetical protein
MACAVAPDKLTAAAIKAEAQNLFIRSLPE